LLQQIDPVALGTKPAAVDKNTGINQEQMHGKRYP
jgi:hypothetical protein